jgi:hypothetical protein
MGLPAIALVSAFAAGTAIGFWPALVKAETSSHFLLWSFTVAALFLAAAGLWSGEACSQPGSCRARERASPSQVRDVVQHADGLAHGVSDPQHVLGRSLPSMELPHPTPTVAVDPGLSKMAGSPPNYCHARFKQGAAARGSEARRAAIEIQPRLRIRDFSCTARRKIGRRSRRALSPAPIVAKRAAPHPRRL